MATSPTRKDCAQSAECKQGGVAHCEGCRQAFCIKHFNEHRLALDEEMNVLIGHYNEFRTTLDGESANPYVAIRLREINQWEVESVDKIQKRADAMRQELLKLKAVHIETIALKFQLLSEKIQASKAQDDFIEMDLSRWRKRLEDMKSNLISPTTIALNQHTKTALVNNISVSFLYTGNELFERALSSDVSIEEDGEIVKGMSYFMRTNEIRGKNNYAFGCHKVRLQIEHSSKQWTFLGINSAKVPLQKASHEAKSAYGWCSENSIYSGGSTSENRSHPPVEMNLNDIITLIFDCDNRLITMINERTEYRHELPVDTKKCPLPWQLHVALRNWNTSLRILSS